MDDDALSKQRAADIEMVDKHVEALGEYFDNVQIFVCRHMPGEHDGTVSVNRGAGNWFARYGQTREWVVYEEQKIRAHADKIVRMED